VALLLGFVKLYRIPAASMEQTLHCARPLPGCSADSSDRILVLRSALAGDPRRGHLVAYRASDRQAAACGASGTFVHRVIGLAGERVELRGQAIGVDGELLDEPYLAEDTDALSSTFEETLIPAEHIFVLGDNRDDSCDGRVWGTLPREEVIGTVIARHWPPSRIGRPESWTPRLRESSRRGLRPS
jgi:signal peptidase I